jgi:predicted 2-oxoglutarate/Fe(II)-dependent dioxygenase YbiX
LSLVACFSDGFEGGELEFPFFDLKIKLEKNSLVLFPSNFPYTHIAHPVTSGTKYSLVTWFV